MKLVQSPHWPQLSAMLDELLDADPAAREARLAQLRRSDAALADELAQLLAEESRVDAEGFLEGGILPTADARLEGRQIGAYTVEAPLGAGGMGSVWLARRSDGRYEGQVALKLLNLALLGRSGAARFEREGSALARLTHPHIARLLDAGVAPGGQPYLVLERVEGEPIDTWCDRHALATRGRVELMLDVLSAVAHAHQKLVLHRDLKPGNILVDAAGQAKLLDFGIAKLLDGKGDGDGGAPPAALTQAAGRAFTPDYAAPEQVEGGEVTTATDVYALGVLLVVLLSGQHPTAQPTDAPMQRLRSVVDTAPKRPSTLASADVAAAAARASTPARLASALRGDLDNICAKALKKDPAERYATVDALADDLRRHLQHQPVLARADSFGYRAAKFVRRNRAGVAAAAGVFVAIVAGIVGTAWQAVEADRQRADALRQRDRAQALLARNEAIVGFVDVMFTEAVPSGQAAVLREMLDRSERLVGTVFAGDPAQQAEIMRVLGNYYRSLDLPNRQVALLARARGLVERNPDRSLQARLACAHASGLLMTGEPAEALRVLAPWIDPATDIEPQVAAFCLQTRAIVAQSAVDAPAALRYAQAGLDRLRASGESAPLLEATLTGDVGFALYLSGRNAEADRSYESALARLRELGRSESTEAVRTLMNRGIVRNAMSDFRGGLDQFDEVVRIYSRRGGAGVSVAVLANQAFGLEQLERHAEALAAYERTLEAARRNGFVGGQAYALVGRAATEAALGRMEAAQASLDEAAAALGSLEVAHPARIRQALVQAGVDAGRGDLAAAAARYTGVIDVLAAQGASTPAQVNAHRLRADIELRRGAHERALADADRAVQLARTLQGSNAHSDLKGLALLTLGRVLQGGADAGRARATLNEAHAELVATLGEQHPQTRAAAALLENR